MGLLPKDQEWTARLNSLNVIYVYNKWQIQWFVNRDIFFAKFAL